MEFRKAQLANRPTVEGHKKKMEKKKEVVYEKTPSEVIFKSYIFRSRVTFFVTCYIFL